MLRDERKLLFDMKEACDLIQRFTAGKSFADYVSDPLLRSAVERQCQILGEALLQLSRSYPEEAARIPEARSIVSFRHVLVHGYDKIEQETVWGVVCSKISPLREDIERMLTP